MKPRHLSHEMYMLYVLSIGNIILLSDIKIKIIIMIFKGSCGY